MQIKSVKNLKREVEKIDLSSIGVPNLPDYFNKIPCVLFSSKSQETNKTVNFIQTKISEGKLSYEELPDIIVCMDKGVLFYSPYLHHLAQQMGKSSNDVPKRAFVFYESVDKAIILVIFLQLFFNFNSPSLQLSDFIVKPYLNEIPTSKNIKVYEIK